MLPEELVSLLTSLSEYTAGVVATSHAGLASETSLPLVLDDTPPPVSAVRSRWTGSFKTPFAHNTNQSTQTVICVSKDAPLLELSWGGAIICTFAPVHLHTTATL